MKQSDWPVIKLVAIAKNEAPYIPLWVFHHFGIGIDLIEIHINNTDDNSIRICKKIKKRNKDFHFLKSDPLFKESTKAGRSFQIDAYNKSLNRSKDGKDCANYIIALDLDEYLTPKNLEGNIKKLIQSSPSADIFSFLWYSDDFEERKPSFSLPFRGSTSIYRMDHVKSMAKISTNLTSCNHHNFIYRESYIPRNQFAERSEILLSDDKNTSIRRSKVNREFLYRLDPLQPEEWFVLHCIYRSEAEYLASLCRGRGHNNDARPIKSNRWGFQQYPQHPSDKITFTIPKENIINYRKNYNLFKRNNNLKGKIKRARRFVANREKSLDKIISNNPSIVDTYKRCFFRTKFDPPTVKE